MYRLLVAAFVLYAIYHTYLRYRSGHISTRRTIFWIALWAGVVAVSWVPQATDRISRMLGVQQGVNLFLFLSVLMLVYLVFLLYTQLEAMRRQITDLVRELALRDLKPPAPTDRGADTSRHP